MWAVLIMVIRCSLKGEGTMVVKPNHPKIGTKTRQDAAERKIKALQKELDVAIKGDAQARGQWTRANNGFLRATKAIMGIANRSVLEGKQATKTQQGRFTQYQKLVDNWPNRSVELTKKRNEWREKMAKTEEALSQAKTLLAVILVEDTAQARATDEIVEQVFNLNDAVVAALHRRNDFLEKHVFPRLFDNKGNLRSQITFTSSDELRKVVVLVNRRTTINPDLAAEARAEIDQFFGKFQTVSITPETKPLYDLTEKILYQKILFKAGYDLHRFLDMDLDPQIFPELVRAQSLLRQSIRSEKTDQYIRLFKRKHISDNWKPLAQS